MPFLKLNCSGKVLSKKYPSFKQDLIELLNTIGKNPETGESLGKNMYEQVLLAEIYDKTDYSTVDENLILKNLKAEGFDLF